MKTGHKFDINSSLLGYWEQNRSSYPRLYRLAIRLLSIPATNLSSERYFSTAGLILTDYRSRLSSQNVNELLFIRSNFDLHWICIYWLYFHLIFWINNFSNTLNVRKTGKPDRNENLGLRTGQESVSRMQDRTGIPF